MLETGSVNGQMLLGTGIAEILIGSVLAFILFSIAIVDARQLRIPDGLNALLFAMGLVASAVCHRQSVVWAVTSAAIAFVLLWSLRALHQRWRRQTGLGLGDVKLIGSAGAWIGLDGLPMMLLIASLAGLCYALLPILWGRQVKSTDKVPFGPFLSGGLWTTWWLGLA